MIAPDLASSGVWTAVVIITVYWLGVIVTLRGGIGVIAKLASSGVLIGTLIPGALLVTLGIVYLAQGNPSAAPMDVEHIFPAWTGIASIVLIVSNFGAYSGMEMNAVHVNRLRDPSRQFIRVMLVATALVLLILILPPLAISWVVPAGDVSLTAGIMQAFEAVLAFFGIQWLTPIIALAIVSASLAGFLTWLAGPSRSLLLVSREGGYMPPWFQRTNEAGVQVNILAAQGALTTVLALLYAFVPAVSNAYWIFMTITTSCLPAHVPVHVRRRVQPSEAPTRPSARLSRAGPHAALRHGLPLLARGDPDQLRPALAARDAEHDRLPVFVGGGILLLGAIVPALFLWLRKPSWKLAEHAVDEPPPEAGVVSDRALYWIVGAGLGVLLIVMLVGWNYDRQNDEADAKAQELIAAFEQAGLTAPDQDQIARTLGDDGGQVCETADSELVQGYWKLRLMVGGEFYTRAVRLDGRVRQGLSLVVDVYCPEKRPDIEDLFEEWDFDDVVRD